MRFLIDECLSIDLVSVASQAGYEAQHVAHIGKAGWKDWNVARHASDGDFVMVTNNAGDFRRVYAMQPLHCGPPPPHYYHHHHHHPKRRDKRAGISRQVAADGCMSLAGRHRNMNWVSR